METKVLDIKGKEQGSINLPDSLFGVKANPTFLHEVMHTVEFSKVNMMLHSMVFQLSRILKWQTVVI